MTHPVRNTSCTDLLSLFEAKWFGDGADAGGAPDYEPPALPIVRRGSGGALSHGRRSGSADRLPEGSAEGSLGAVVLAFPPPPAGAAANEQAYEPRSARLPPTLPAAGSSQQQGGPAEQQQQRIQAGRTRSEPLAAAGGYEPALPNSPGPQPGPAGAEAAQPGPALGTWANRQRVFVQQQAQQAAGAGRPHAPRIDEEGGEGAGEGPSAAAASGAPSASRPVGGADGGQQRGKAAAAPEPDSIDEEDELNAAWRWRFARKWQTEQAKQFDPEYGKEGGDDEWGDALGYMDALAGGLNLQIARTVSTDQYASLPLMSPTLSQSMLLDASIKESPLASAAIDDGSSMNATRHIVAVARRAQQLLQQQQEIERQVEQRWESAAAGQPWVGQHLPAVTVDSWGKFPFVLVRLLDRSSRHKVLVRGKNGAEEGALFAQLEQEVSRAAVQHRLPGARLELLGSGAMEWSRERDRTLSVTASRLASLNDARLRSKADVSKLAGALAQAALPVTYKILVEGKPPA